MQANKVKYFPLNCKEQVQCGAKLKTKVKYLKIALQYSHFNF